MNHGSDKKTGNGSYEQFLKLLRSNEKKIYGHILTLVVNRGVAEDIMQETMVVMWRKFSDYKEGTNFAAWGITIGRYLVLSYFRKERRSIVHFSSEAMENISDSVGVFDNYDARTEALHGCLKQLPDESQQILKLRYQQNKTIQEIAAKIHKPIHGFYKQVTRIHLLLQRCIEGKLTAWRDGI